MIRFSYTAFLFTLMGLLPVVVFAQRETDSSRVQPERKSNVLKFAPLESFVGDFPVYFERLVTKKLSLMGGLGLTSKSAFYELGRNITDLDTRTYTDALLGFSFKAGARYYYSERKKAPGGPYFETRLQYRYFQAYVSACNDPFAVTVEQPYLKEDRNLFDYFIHWGVQAYSRSHFVLDFYAGSGLRYRFGFPVQCTEQQGLGIIPARVHQQEVSVWFSTGLALGFGL